MTPPSFRRRAVLGAAAGALFAPLLAGCSDAGGASTAAGGKVTLTFAWWGNDDRAQRTNAAVALFEKRHPNITVRTSFAGYPAYVQKLATQAAGGDLSDVAQLDYRQISQYAGSGTLLDLGPYVDNGTLRTADFDQTLTRTGVYDNKQYALPMGKGTTGIVYDAAVFKKAGVATPRPGWTWDDWAEAGKKITALGMKGPNGHAYTGLSDLGVNEDAFETWLRGRGKELYASEHRLGFTADDLTDFWTFTDKLRRAGVVSQARDTAQVGGAVEDTPMGRGIAATDFNWDAPFLGYPPLLGDQVHFAPVPTTDGKVGQYFKPTMLIGAGAGTQHPKEAAELIDFLLNDPAAGKILGVTRSTPPNEKIAEEIGKGLTGPEKEVYDYGRTIAAHGTSAPPMAPPRGDVVLQVSFTRDYQRVSYGMESPRGAAEEYVAEAKRELR
ncbi:ABC transporter substrate-binding protein [Streptomyces sp. N50]|uniref:ABC transporter substrate-binding protein n=1 Tax=Streptomyces sp. N50 TaxID=3081765 RepID=UPI0029624810|nr:extracellular solute-binding protein [Streptomyces sp. N50]WOX15069.1 extracellular solute-binding protein [Streptomyces sp. N50]